MTKKPKFGAVLVVLFLLGAGVVAARNLYSRTLLRTGDPVAISAQLGPQIDRALREAMAPHQLESQNISTKIVPLLSVENRAPIGLVQVSGSKDAVDKTKAVVQIGTRVPPLSASQARVLVPIDSADATHFKRVSGVGVCALIDIKL